MRVSEWLSRAGCLAIGLATFALFFAVGFIVSLVSGDFMMMLQSLVVAALLAGAALWLGRRHAATRGR